MGLSNITINFHEPGKVYLPGDKVGVTVTVVNDKPMKARSVKMIIEGFSETERFLSWNHHLVYRQTKLLWVSDSSKNQMPVGTFDYEFVFKLPDTIAPTLNIKNGRNTHRVSVQVDRPWREISRVDKELTVSKNLGKEYLPCYNKTMVWEQNIQSGLIFSDGTIQAKFVTPSQVFKAGQTFDTEVTLNNTSGNAIKSVQYTLFRHTHFHKKWQPTPCSNSYKCHLHNSEQFFTYGRYGKGEKHKTPVAPYTEGKFKIPFTIPAEATTPSFASGMMTHGYLLVAHVQVKGAITLSSYLRIYIGDVVENEDVQRKTEKREVAEKKTTKKEEITEEEEAPPSYSSCT
ncbi:hypothetical protein L5515_012984 [Caenorhabditis briggsae]|uniref:Arrestin C-terminal-like domain-containing protein n=1 Tax=Caenorhabditis briggsae TaxID=6238 RepID=A0AAE9E8X3_CAEBR|nr:hypothetical protein L5515_012984 [Caenorhabditis briggsae]